MGMTRHEQYCSIKDFANTLRQFQDNKFDGLVSVGGDRGVGKSVFGRVLLREYCLQNNMKFDLDKFTYYSKKNFDKEIETNEERQIFFLDEAISILFNRERLEDMQVDLIKKLNICRYKKHLIVCLAPNFFNLDKGVRDLVRVYVYVDKRPINGNPGFAQIFMKANLPFCTDPWYVKKNEKLGKRFHKSPNYWGTIIIPDHSSEQWFIKMEEEAEKIKDEKKAVAMEESTELLIADKKKIIYPVINLLQTNRCLKHGAIDTVASYFNMGAAQMSTELFTFRKKGIEKSALNKTRSLNNSKPLGEKQDDDGEAVV